MSATARTMRADARRNYERLLAEARMVFAESGADGSLDEIARRAGVGVGTLYRHFPTREALLEAVLRERFEDLARRGEDLLRAESPGAALAEWIREFVAGANTYRGLSAVLMKPLRDETSELFAACHAMRDSGSRLLARATKAGEVRAGVEPTELFTLAAGIAWASEQGSGPDREHSDRLVALLLDGLLAR